MKVEVIGSGNAFTSRVNASVMIDDTLLVDCGPTVPARLFGKGVFPGDILLTHPHGDHVLGLPVYLLKVGIDNLIHGRDTRIRLWGSERTLRVVEDLYRTTYDWGNLRDWVELYPVLSGKAGHFKIGRLEVTYERRRHTAFTDTYVFRIGNLGYATDVSETPEDYPFYRGLNVLIHEFGPPSDHTPLKTVVEMALRAGVGRLYFIHYPDGTDPEVLRPYLHLFDEMGLLREGDVIHT